MRFRKITLVTVWEMYGGREGIEVSLRISGQILGGIITWQVFIGDNFPDIGQGFT